MFKLSLILPVYNERNAIDRTLATVGDFAKLHPDWEFLFVDDGSRDGTADRITEDLRALDIPNMRLLALSKNEGKGYALRRGFDAATGELLCFTDGDLPYSLDQVVALQERLALCDIVIGSRNLPTSFNVVKPLRRRLLGGSFNRIVRWTMGLPYRDTQAGLKGFRRETARLIFSRLRLYGFSFDVEVLYLAKKFGYRVAEIPVRVSSEHAYKTSKLNLIRDSIHMFAGLLRIRLNDLFGHYEKSAPEL